MFVELEELHLGDREQLEWRETARWIKYEEDVLEETDRWGKPHVSSLNFRSLLELRHCIEFGLVNLDMKEEGLSAICSALVDDMVQEGQIPRDYSQAVLQALLLRHVHQCDPHSAPEEPTAHETQVLAQRQSLSLNRTNDTLGYSESRITDDGSQSANPSLLRSASLLHSKVKPLSDRKLARHATGGEYSHSSFSNLNDDLIMDSVRKAGLQQCESPVATVEVDVVSATPSAPVCLQRALSSPTTSFSEIDTESQVKKLVRGSTIPSLDEELSVNTPTTSQTALPMFPGHASPNPIGPRNAIKTDLQRLQSVPNRTLASADGTEGEREDGGEVVATLPREERQLWEHLPSNVEGTTVLVGSLDFLESPIVAFIRLAEGQQLKHVTEVPVPVRFLFVMIGPPRNGSEKTCHSAYHEVGRSIATLMADEGFQQAASTAQSRSDLLEAMNSFLDGTFVIPPGKWDGNRDKDLLLSAFQATNIPGQNRDKESTEDNLKEVEDPLARTGKIFGGMICDLKRLKRRYVSDITDAKNMQVLFTSLFMYFAALAPVITFGGLLGRNTRGNIALSEMLIATSLGGMIFSLLTGQPLMLIGPTGPLLVFEKVIYEFCDQYNISFLPFRFWTGVWIFVSLVLIVATDTSLFVKKFTRFTEEVFTALIGFIFMYESLKSIVNAFKTNSLSSDFCQLGACQARVNWSQLDNTSQCLSATPIGSSAIPENEPNTALVYFILVIGTFSLAYALRVLRHSKYLSKEIRRTISDFGILITMTTAVLIAHFLFESVSTEKIAAASFATTSGRSWIVNPLGGNLHAGYIFAAIVPGLLVAFLIFMETQVTAFLIVGSPDHKLVKGQSFHWNLMIVSFLVAMCSLLGLPWLCGTPVPSLSHTSSLLQYRKDRAPGERPSVSGAVEQRVSNFVIHTLLLITLTTPVAKLMQQVPVAVLFGVFLYLGCISLLGLQLIHRIVLLLIPPKHHPDNLPYVRAVRTRSMHLYTGIQLSCLLVLSIVKLTPAALIFPIIILLMVPLRSFVVTRFFSDRELLALDPHGGEDDGEIVDEFTTVPIPA